MEDYYFTFGTRHKHPVLGIDMSKRWVRISAPNFNAARICMSLLFGPRWSFQYEESKFDRKYFTDGEFIHISCNDASMNEETKNKFWEALDG